MQESEKISKFTVMLEEIVNNAIIDRRNVLANRQMHPENHNVVDSLEKAKAGQEGEVRTRKDGSKWKKVGGEWKPVVERRQAPEKPSSSKRSDKQDSKPEMGNQEGEVSNHHKGILKHVKKLVTSNNFEDAHTVAEKLPDDVKQHIPSDIWQKMSEANLKASKKMESEKSSQTLKKEKVQPKKSGVKGLESLLSKKK